MEISNISPEVVPEPYRLASTVIDKTVEALNNLDDGMCLQIKFSNKKAANSKAQYFKKYIKERRKYDREPPFKGYFIYHVKETVFFVPLSLKGKLKFEI